MMNNKTIGMIGLGRMGSRLVKRYAEAGYDVFAFDASPEVSQQLSVQGVQIVDSVADIGKHARSVILSLPNTEIVKSVVSTGLIRSMGEGSVIIDTSTIAPSACEELSKACQEKRIDFLDAPVSGGIPWAETGDLVIMAGGAYEAFERSIPVLQVIGKKIFHIGPSGSGQRMKLCHQLVFYATSMAVIESVRMGESLHIERSKLLQVLSACVAPNHVLAAVRSNLENHNYHNVLTEIHLALKDLKLIDQLVERHVENPLSSFLANAYQRAVDAGLGQMDQTVMSKNDQRI